MPKYKKIIEGAEALSLGISIVVAVLIGIGIGIWLKNTFHQMWLLWLGVFWGVSAAVLNIYKAYKKQLKEFEKLSKKYSEKNFDEKT
jgi:F0F1-type ATP synthase assembly protein I